MCADWIMAPAISPYVASIILPTDLYTRHLFKKLPLFLKAGECQFPWGGVRISKKTIPGIGAR